ncbi:MAG: TonB-dependent receptor [Candidatus Binatia bacterium]
MTTLGRLVGLGAVVTAAAILGGLNAGWAQPAKGKKAGPGAAVEVEEITVTAQKREENVQETPISIVAITGEALQEKQITNVVDLNQAVPNLHITGYTGSNSTITIAVRGVAQADNQIALQPSVGLYLDGAYLAKIIGANLDLDDLERVEVLRGPQGTLWGRNTAAGAVNFITRKPSEERSITLSTEAGNYNFFKERLTLNVPLVGKNGFVQSDAIGTLSIRETAVYRHRDAFYRNTGTGSGGYDNLNRVSTMTSVRWQPTTAFTLDYLFEYHRYRNDSTLSEVVFVRPGSATSAPPFDLRPYIRGDRVDSLPTNDQCVPDIDNGITCGHPQIDHGNHRMNVLTGTWDLGEVGALGSVTLKSIAEYRDWFTQQDQDLDGSPLHVIDIFQHDHYQTWSEELQWIGTAPRVKYVIGGYYYGERSRALSQNGIFSGAFALPSINRYKTASYAGFGQATYTPPILGDKLSFTAGLRFSQEQVHFNRQFRCLNIIQGGVNLCNALPPAIGLNLGLNDFNVQTGKAFGGIHGSGTPGISPMGDIAYQWTDNLMTYVRVARGFKSGTFSGAANIPQLVTTPVQPERLLAYEGGFKSQWFDNRLRFNGTGFYEDYTDQQISVFRAAPQTGTQVSLENAGSSEIFGAEVEVGVVPVRGVEVNVAYAYLAPKFTEFLEQAFDANNNPILGQTVNVADEREFALAPEHSFSVGLSYTAPPTSAGVFSAHLDTSFQSSVFFAPINFENTEAGSYAVVNGRLQFAEIPLAMGSLDLALWGRNLFDRQYRVFGIDFGEQLGWAVNKFGEPRTFGLQLTYNFTQTAASPPPAVVQAAPPPPAPPAKKKIVLRSVHFDFDKATLKAEAKPILDEALQVLKQEGSVDIVVEGHTDSVGTEQYNLGLSRRRADTVRRYLVDHGIAASRIAAEGLGEAKPVASNDTADGRAQNRRVELHVR